MKSFVIRSVLVTVLLSSVFSHPVVAPRNRPRER